MSWYNLPTPFPNQGIVNILFWAGHFLIISMRVACSAEESRPGSWRRSFGNIFVTSPASWTVLVVTSAGCGESCRWVIILCAQILHCYVRRKSHSTSGTPHHCPAGGTRLPSSYPPPHSCYNPCLPPCISYEQTCENYLLRWFLRSPLHSCRYCCLKAGKAWNKFECHITATRATGVLISP